MTPVGVWRSIDDKTGEAKSQIRIAETGGALNGRIEKLLRKDAKQDAVCDECTDDRKGKPHGRAGDHSRREEGRGREVWEDGKILDPENGKNTRCGSRRSTAARSSKCAARFGIGRTQTWVRVQ